MSLIQRLSNSIRTQSSTVLLLVPICAVFGTILELSGGIWDAISHVLREPEFFWTVQHITVYSGVSFIATSGILGFIILKKGKFNKKLQKGIIVIIIGSVVQISAGYGDSLSHDVYGIDGLLSWSHQPLEIGLVLSALGAFLVLRQTHSPKLKKIMPVSILTLILSLSWIGFNISLLMGNTILCLPFYEIFSSGCAIL